MASAAPAFQMFEDVYRADEATLDLGRRIQAVSLL